jgi:hypothetical protein
VQEVEKQYKEGTIKHVIVEVLKAVKPEALTTQGERIRVYPRLFKLFLP